MARSTSRRDRFEAKTSRCPVTGCWWWTGYANREGYGMVGDGRRVMLAHRAAWEIFRGPIPPETYVCHRCDQPACVNPDHLFLGSSSDNAQDRKAKGRQASHVGERNGRARLTLEQVAEIRARYAAGGVLQTQLAAEYRVSQPTISRVVLGQGWDQAAA